MNIAILRVCGKCEDLERLRENYKFEVYSQWKKGAPLSKTKSFSESGFKVSIPDGNSPSDMIEILSSLLLDLSIKGINFKDFDVTATIDIGFSIGEENQFAAIYDLSLGFLELAVQCGVSISLSGYPVDEDDED
ncbi:hypothetical protein K0H59_20445 [Shewanella sp. FJAT-51649]|uniref:hypothetical protein n=1 Tax=Shewanella sp. FJAT-51649 TaxID=2864210 RepID=UPI001C65D051|nr:hypothetical protein [Shewanella sp. FJAT-51649]QYJ71347.1 hypothetical protein K0H59_20445 [Shewanella sp. FJAT-51649]